MRAAEDQALLRVRTPLPVLPERGAGLARVDGVAADRLDHAGTMVPAGTPPSLTHHAALIRPAIPRRYAGSSASAGSNAIGSPFSPQTP